MNTSKTFADNLLNNLFANVNQPENADSVETLLDKYGLNWKVSKEPLQLPTGATTGFYGIVRKDTQATFSTCKDGYVPFQNSELAEMLIRLSEKTGFDLDRGGCFNSGAKVYLQLKSPNIITNIGENNDTVKGYLTGINSHDGTTSLKWGESNITISCQNTFYAAMREIKNSARHTVSIHDRVEEAIKLITGVVKQEKSLFDTYIKLAEVPATRENIAKVVKNITEVDTLLTKTEIERNYTTYAINRTGEILNAIGKEMKQKGSTMWGLLSGVTNYTTHTMPVPKRDNARLESIYTGTGFATNNNAFAAIKEMAGV